jgi:hypothetical protein
MARPFAALLFLPLLPLVLFACGARVEDPTPTPTPTSGSSANPPPAAVDPATPAPAPADPMPAVGGNCTYRDIDGVATVVALDSTVDNTTIGVCHRARTRVSFTFAANDPSLLDKPDGAEVFTIGGGDEIPTSCVEPAGLKVGATFTITRRAETSGSCSPLYYAIPKTSAAYVCSCTKCEDTGTGGCS